MEKLMVMGEGFDSFLQVHDFLEWEKLTVYVERNGDFEHYVVDGGVFKKMNGNGKASGKNIDFVDVIDDYSWKAELYLTNRDLG